MLFRVDPLASEPIFEQIVLLVKSAVARGELKAGERLPSVRDLAKRVAVNPNTVVKAYDVLEAEGVIVRRHGAGCFVTDRAPSLSDAARRERLRALIDRAVTEAFHLGYGAAEIREELARGLKEIRFRKDGRSRT